MKNIRELGLETIQLDDQVLLVDRKSRIRNGDFILGGADDESFHEIWVMDNHFISEEDCKVLASTKPLEGLPLLVTEDEVDSIVESEFKIKHPSDETHWKKALWKDGYATAKETYKFTEEDLKKILEFWGERGRYDKEGFTCSFEKWWEQTGKNSIESLTKKELWVEVEEKHFRTVKNNEGQLINHQFTIEPKITEGKIKAVWK